MKRINDIVSDAIDVRINDDNKDKTFDISKIDFDLLSREYGFARNLCGENIRICFCGICSS